MKLPSLAVLLLCGLAAAAAEGPVTHFDVTVPATINRTVPFDVVVRAMNAQRQTVESYTGTVHFTASSPDVVLPPATAFTPADQGVRTFSVTSNRGGSVRLTVSDGSVVGGLNLYVRCPDYAVTATNGGPVCPNYGGWIRAEANMPTSFFRWYRLGSVAFVLHGSYHTVPHGTYILQAFADNGCEGGAQTTISELQVPRMRLAFSPTVCDTATVTLKDAAQFTDLGWRVSNAQIISGQGTPTVTLKATAEAYELERFSGRRRGMWVAIDGKHVATDCPAHTDESSYQLQVEDPVSAAITTSAAACPQATLTASVADAGAAAVYSWSIANGVILRGHGTREIEYAGDGAGDVALSVTVAKAGCSATDTKVVSIEGPLVSLSGTFASCGEGPVAVPVALAGTPPFRIVWSDGVVQDNISATATTRTFTASGAYWITEIADANCRGNATGFVDVVRASEPRIAVQPRGTTIASGNTATLTVGTSGEDLLYRWYEGASGDRGKLVSVTTAPSFTTPRLARTTPYWVEVSNDCGTASSQTAIVTVGIGKRRAARH